MALAIATNNAALNAAASASSVNRDMETSMARLSTGKRINSASDDAAGVAISSRLSAEIRGTDQAIRNSLDGQALIDTAEGAHKEIENILQRMREVRRSIGKRHQQRPRQSQTCKPKWRQWSPKSTGLRAPPHGRAPSLDGLMIPPATTYSPFRLVQPLVHKTR